MEPTTGLEPVDLFLTKEALYLLSYVGQPLFSGAGDETRTRDIQLGRLKLYQLSYSRPRPALKKTPNLTKVEKSPHCIRSREFRDVVARFRKPQSPTCIRNSCVVVVGGGFEPPKAAPADLQSAPFDRSGTPPNLLT